MHFPYFSVFDNFVSRKRPVIERNEPNMGFGVGTYSILIKVF